MTGNDGAPLGELIQGLSGPGLRFERRLAHPPEKVWRAITESDHLRAWFPCDIVGERAESAPLRLPFWPAHVEKYGLDDPPLRGEIRVWDPPRVFEWTWDVDVLRWELAPAGSGTLLTFTTWLGAPDTYSPEQTAAGYHVCLDHLVRLLDEGSAPPLVDADTKLWEQRYSAAMNLGG